MKKGVGGEARDSEFILQKTPNSISFFSFFFFWGGGGGGGGGGGVRLGRGLK